MSLNGGIMSIMVTVLISSLVLSTNGSPCPLGDRIRRRDDSQTPTVIFWPSDIVAVSQAQPDHSISNAGIADSAYIYSLPGADEDIGIEIAFPIPVDLLDEASCALEFFTLNEEVELADWVKNLDGEHRFSIFLIAATTISISSEDTWDDRPQPDFTEGFIATGIVNNTGVYLTGGSFECHKAGPQAQFWLQCEEDQYCDISWPETRISLSGLVLEVYKDLGAY